MENEFAIVVVYDHPRDKELAEHIKTRLDCAIQCVSSLSLDTNELEEIGNKCKGIILIAIGDNSTKAMIKMLDKKEMKSIVKRLVLKDISNDILSVNSISCPILFVEDGENVKHCCKLFWNRDDTGTPQDSCFFLKRGEYSRFSDAIVKFLTS
jgi:hypothetical protein